MATVNEITQSIISQARLIDPNISLEVGTPERKIVEAVAEAIAVATVDIEVLSGQLYLDELAGARIDSFVSLFGFGRRIGSRATGIVTISRPNSGIYDTVIPKGTQFSTRPNNNIPGLIFVATETVRLRAEDTRALVRVECTTAGTVGNLPAGVIDGLPNSINIPGVATVTNETATSGGTDSETDEQLKARFQNTIFRNMAGTNDQYLALTLSHPAVSKANVIGPQSRYVEYLQMPTGPDGTAHPASAATNVYTTSLSTVPYSKYTYSNNYYVVKGVGKAGKFLRPGRDFVFNNPARQAGGTSSIPAGNVAPNYTFLTSQTVIGGTTIDVPGEIFLFEHTYLSKASRNDWANNIHNCVDIYINGQQDTVASSEEAFPSAAMNLVNNSTKITHYKNYRRIATNGDPLVGSRLQILYHQPLTDTLDGAITINGSIYYEAKYIVNGKAFTGPAYYRSSDGGYYTTPTGNVEATPAHYFIVEDVTSLGGTIRARDGIEWLPSSAILGTKPVPADGARFTLNYRFNSAVTELQAIVERNKQITTDVLVHESTYRYMRLYITVMYTPGFTDTTVNLQIANSLTGFFNTQYYGSAIQLSDILQVIHNTSGVDNVRWTYENGGGHKVEAVTRTGNSFATPTYYDSDFLLNDNELPSLPDIADGEEIENALVIVTKAQNTWNS